MQLSSMRMGSNLVPVCNQNIFKSMRLTGGQRNVIVVPEKCHSTFFIELGREKFSLSLFIDKEVFSVFLLSFFLGQKNQKDKENHPAQSYRLRL